MMNDFDYRRDNDVLRGALARSDQQIEWLSRENAALKRHAEEVTKGLLELRRVTSEALAVVRERVVRDATELAKWKAEAELATEWYTSYKHQAEAHRKLVDKLLVQLEDAERENDRLREQNTFLHGVIGKAMDRDSKL